MTRTHLLTDGWELAQGVPEAGRPAPPDDADWIPAHVPGDVHSDLLAAGRIPDPFVDQQVDEVQWVEATTWWYRRSLTVPPGRTATERDVLTFGGLDLVATVFLDGREVAHHANMHRPLEVDITEHAAPGSQVELLVRFDPIASLTGDGRYVVDEQWGHYYADDRVGLHKTQAQFSWDHTPRLVCVGIWLPVRLSRHDRARIVRPAVRSVILDQRGAIGDASVVVSGEVEQWGGQTPAVSVRLSGHGSEAHGTAKVVDGRFQVSLDVPDAALWWPIGYGDPALYDLAVELEVDATPVDRWDQPVGIRSMSLDRTPDPLRAGEELFAICVNGVRVFARGADWIPTDMLNGRVDRSVYERLLGMLGDAGGNVIRVWGGGQFEPDDFYDECDRRGILVWHDFMLACARYPDSDEQWLEELRLASAYQIVRLRNHASLALWCGSNELDWLEETEHGLPRGESYPGSRAVHEVIASLVHELDPATPWWPSSPHGGNDYNSEEVGDRHNWTTWHGVPMRNVAGTPPRPPAAAKAVYPSTVGIEHLEADRSRFLSEFGSHAMPDLATLRTYLTDLPRDPADPRIRFRDRNGVPGRMDTLMRTVTGVPLDLADYVTASQFTQAEALRAGIEASRRRHGECYGVMFWQWNDNWPGMTWSVIDYPGRPKAGYYTAKRLWAPRILVATEDGTTTVITAVNDTAETFSDIVAWELTSTTGEVAASGSVAVDVPPRSARVVAVVDSPAEVDRARRVLWARAVGDPSVTPARRYYVPFRDIQAPPAELTVDWTRDGGDLVARISSPTVAFGVMVRAASAVVVTDDNNVDIPAGGTAEIRVPDPDGTLSPEDFVVTKP